MWIRVVVTVMLVSLMAFADSDQPAKATGVLLVAEKGTRNLAIVDPSQGMVMASIPEGGDTGHEVAASPDGTLAYVPIYGDSGVGQPGTDGRKLVVINIAAHRVTNALDFGHGVRPHCPVFGPKDGLLYVTTELDKTVTVIDPNALTIVGTIPTGQAESHMLGVIPRRTPRLHR